MLARRILLLLALSLGARLALAGEPTEAERLYRAYESLNNPENLAADFKGGALPTFIGRQVELLRAIAARPPNEAAPVLARIADEYLARVEKVGAPGFARSPLGALQIPLVTLLAKHVAADEVRARLDALAKSPVIKEYTRGRALGALADYRAKAVPAAEDPAGERRVGILFDTLIGEMPLRQLLYAPARMWSLAASSSAISGHDLLALAKALAAATTTPARRYAADVALAAAAAAKQRAGMPLLEPEKKLLLEACTRWVEQWRPEILKLKYPSDVLGVRLRSMANDKGNEDIALLLRENGIELVRQQPPDEAARPEEPEFLEGQEAVAKVLAQAVAAVKRDDEPEANRLLRRLSADTAIPALHVVLAARKSDPASKAVALRALARNGTDEAIGIVLDSVRYAADKEFLEAACAALTELKNPASVPALLQAVLDGTDSRLGFACAEVLARMPAGADRANALLKACKDQQPEAVPLLAALARDWRAERSALAGIAGLASLGTPEATAALFGLLEEKAVTEEPERVAAVQKALSRLVGDHADEPLVVEAAIERLKAAPAVVRRAAALALGGVQDNEAVAKALGQAAAAEQDKSVAEALQAALKRQQAKD